MTNKGKAREKYEGKVFSSYNYGEFTVLEYSNNRDVLIKFHNTDNEEHVRTSEICSGRVKDYKSKTVYGVGYIGSRLMQSQVNGKKEISYLTWANMIKRCYCVKFLDVNPSYVGCVVCDEWHSFPNFLQWFEQNGVIGFDLDKDLFGSGKLYSPDTCCFLPSKLNQLIKDGKKKKSTLPTGVVVMKKKYQARIVSNGKMIHIGTFPTINEARENYLRVRDIEMNKVIDENIDVITKRVYIELKRKYNKLRPIRNGKNY